MNELSSLPPPSPRRRTRKISQKSPTLSLEVAAPAEWNCQFDALLADLQNTISGPSYNSASGVSSSPGYGSLNGSIPRGDYAVVNSTKLERSNSRCSNKSSPTSPITTTPIYQNEKYFPDVPDNRKFHSPVAASTPPPKAISTSFNNNLSELDNLLQDLSSSRYAERKVPISTPVNGKRSFSPARNTHQNHVAIREQHSPTTRPSVDSLLDELSTSVLQNGSINGGGPYLMKKMTMEETTTTTTRSVRPTASSATRELDDLMASLSDFKIANAKDHHSVNGIRNVESSYAKPNSAYPKHSQPVPAATQLDSMLGTLQAEMNRHGVTTTQKGCCNGCEKPIVGQVITALGKTWHPEHFTCFHCKQELGTRNFFERDSHPYCELDYHNLFSPRCAYCNGPILDKCVTALEKTWHTEHFFCAQCGKQFGEEGFHEREGRPYCKQDYFNMFAPKCGACFRPIMENYVSALSSQWHSACFVCRDCKNAISGKSFYAMEGKPVCPKCVGVQEGE